MYTKKIIITALISTLSTLSGCSAWQTTPVVVDDHFGNAVRHMVKNQTLYPEHGKEYNPVMSINGAKGEGIIRVYRAPATDLREGKKDIKFNITQDN